MVHRYWCRTFLLFWLLHLTIPTIEAQVWTSIGPSPLADVRAPTNPANFNSGRLAAIAVDPDDVNHWLIGVGNGGVWETRDRGKNWGPLSDDWPILSIGAIAF